MKTHIIIIPPVFPVLAGKVFDGNGSPSVKRKLGSIAETPGVSGESKALGSDIGGGQEGDPGRKLAAGCPAERRPGHRSVQASVILQSSAWIEWPFPRRQLTWACGGMLSLLLFGTTRSDTHGNLSVVSSLGIETS